MAVRWSVCLCVCCRGQVKLSNGLTARVVSLDGESFGIDCNHPLAGQPLQLAVAVQQVASADKAPFQRAHFAAGCFWVRETDSPPPRSTRD